MLNGIFTGSSTPIQSFSAVNAFKANQNSFEKTKNQKLHEETPSGVDLNDNNQIFSRQNVEEIRSIAKNAGDDNLTDEDIKYGLTYGRSVIADYLI